MGSRTTCWGIVWTVALCCCVGQADEKAAVDVRYQRQKISAVMGKPLTLSCESTYELELCHHVDVSWGQRNASDFTELTEPARYLTTVNETALDGHGRRRRQVTTQILSLRPRDLGEFQCIAKCENGQEAKGHIIEVFVNDR